MRVLALLALAGCATFEDPTIVLDLRVIGMEAEPPEQILDVDPNRLPTIDELITQLKPIRLRAHIAEPGRIGELVWTMSACILDESKRCDHESPAIDFAGGTLLDPEHYTEGNPCKDSSIEQGGTVCGLLVPDNRFVQLLFQALERDPYRGLAGIDIGFSLRVIGDAEVFAAKQVKFAPRIPTDRKPNQNPHIDQLLLGIGGVGADLQKHHCADLGPINSVQTGLSVTLFPVARDGDKEEYVLPTLDGQSQRLTEYLEYQWVATAGKFTDETTGGPPDVFGNVRLDGSEWRAPDEPQVVQIWVIQRDARYGVRWREACIRVVEF